MSLLMPILLIEEDHPGTYAEVLSETGAFLRHVYSYRCTSGCSKSLQEGLGWGRNLQGDLGCRS